MIALILIFSVSLLTACQTGQEERETPTPTGIQNTDSVDESETPIPTDNQNTASGNAYEKGSLTETDFASKYLDLRFTLPDGLVMATEEDMQEMMGLGAEIMDLDSDLVEYAQLTTVYEMMASSVDGSTNVLVFSEKLSMRNLTVEQYCTALKSQLQGVSSMEYEIDDEIISVEIAGYSYEQVTASTHAYGMDMVQKYLVRKLDDRMVGFIITNSSDTEDTLNTLMAGFSKY